MVVEQVPAPVGDADAPARAMIFDSVYDTYRGVVTYIRVVDGRITPRERIQMMSTGATHELLEVGIISPEPKPREGLGVGEVGYLITGVKDVRQSRVGDTVTSERNGATEALAGYRDPKPMVFAGLYPMDGSDYPELRDALDKLRLNDAALTYEPETSAALGIRLPLRVPRPAAPGDHPRPARARVRPRPDLHRAQRGLPGRAATTAPSMTVTNPADWPDGKVAEELRAGRQVHRHRARASSSARSWSSARAGAARCEEWTTCRSPGWRCVTRCRWLKSCSTSSTP